MRIPRRNKNRREPSNRHKGKKIAESSCLYGFTEVCLAGSLSVQKPFHGSGESCSHLFGQDVADKTDWNLAPKKTMKIRSCFESEAVPIVIVVLVKQLLACRANIYWIFRKDLLLMKDLMQDLASYTRSELNVPYKQRRDKMLRAPSYPLMEKVLKALAGFRKILGDDLNDFQKLCLLYQMICEAGTYDWTRRKSLSHSFLGALKGVAVCAGYAELFVLLVGDLTESYTPYFIIGYTGNDISLVKESENSHAWVIIQDKNSGRAWHCDPTWDLGAKQYRYFFKTDKEMTGRIWAAKCLPACAESFTGHIYTNREKLALLVDYYKSMPQRFESGNFTVG